MQKKKEEELQREKELNELFKVAISQPKVPVGMLLDVILVCSYFPHYLALRFSYSDRYR
jgi:hypothetical protein